MSARLVCYAALLALLSTVGSSGDAWAQSADERAAQLNEEGKELWLKKKDLRAASAKFRQATTLSPQPQYYFNLCYALHQLGEFAEARTACRAVQTNGGDAKLQEKAAIVLDDIAKRIPEQPGPTGTGTGTGTGDSGTGDQETGDQGTGDQGTGDSGTGDQGTGDQGTGDQGTGDQGTGDQGTGDSGTGTDMGTIGDGGTGTPPGPIPGLYQPAQNPDEYKWAVGADLGFTGTNMADGLFGNGGLTIRGFMDFAGLRNLHAGVQLYAAYTALNGGVSQVNMVDLGGALFKNVRLTVGPRRYIYITPLVGAHFSILTSGEFQAPFAAIGLRAEATATWLVGADRRHAIRGGLTFNYSLPYSNDYAEEMNYGLDRSSLSAALIVGYSLRFTTPFGKASLITLE